MKNEIQLAGIINIDSEALFLDIGQRKDNELKILEKLEYPINYAEDTFNSGKISVEKIEKTCSIINGFKRILNGYKIKKVRLTGTTAIREALNIAYINDQIKCKTKYDIHILDDTEEKAYIYKEIIKKIEMDKNINENNSFFAYIGTGSLGLAFYSDKSIIFSQNFRIGTAKLNELIGSLQKKSERFYIIIDEYLSSFNNSMKTTLPSIKIDNFIACGKEMNLISKLCKTKVVDDISFIPKSSFDNLFEQVKDKSPKQMASRLGIPENMTQMLLPSMCIYRMLRNIIEKDNIIVVPGSLTTALLYELLFKDEFLSVQQEYQKNTVISAINLGKRFNIDIQHSLTVEKFALEIFDSIKKIHFLGNKERLLLQLGSILHDIGKYINIKEHAIHSYNVINATDILGLTIREREIVALLAKYHSSMYLDINTADFDKFNQQDKVIISKLSAILKIADSLDRAHNKKIQKLEIHTDKEIINIIVYSTNEIILEKWAFERKSQFFEEVFGIKIQLTRGAYNEFK